MAHRDLGSPNKMKPTFPRPAQAQTTTMSMKKNKNKKNNQAWVHFPITQSIQFGASSAHCNTLSVMFILQKVIH